MEMRPVSTSSSNDSFSERGEEGEERGCWGLGKGAQGCGGLP